MSASVTITTTRERLEALQRHLAHEWSEADVRAFLEDCAQAQTQPAPPMFNDDDGDVAEGAQ